MLDNSDLTVYKNADGITSALGYPINSFLLQGNKPSLFGGSASFGNGLSNASLSNASFAEPNKKDLAVPVGLVCVTETICRNADENVSEADVVPDGLYEKLMALAETKPSKKMTRRTKPMKNKKTHKRK
jgi:hypothetical protein